LPSAALASSCDNFNLFRFDPAELERCISEMKFSETLDRNVMNSQIKLLQLQVCNLAHQLAELKPMPDDDLKSYCFAAAAAESKKAAPKQRPQSK
jgi:hypothetical protein